MTNESTFHTRLIAEKEELDDKLSKLNKFIIEGKINSLDSQQQVLLRKQSDIMLQYSNILAERLALLE